MKFQPPKGTRDLLPQDAEKFQQMVNVIRETFERYGFVPLFTPVFESFGLLSSKGGYGEAVKDEIYYFKDKAGRELGMRFDLTMPLSRFVSSNPQLPKPFKRYAIEKVWRYDNPQALRWREFWQADIDVVGSDSELADAECLAAVCEILDKLGFKDYSIRVSSRKLIENLLSKFVPDDKMKDVFRTIDKLDKLGSDEIKKQLDKIGVNSKKILDLLKRKETNEEISKLLDYAKSFGIEDRIKIDLSLVRGLDYYTGLVFELNLGENVSCGAGGRYDNLIEIVGGKSTPATGISLGLDRIFEVMKEKNMFENFSDSRQVFVASVDEKSGYKAIEIANELRENGITCQIDLMGWKLTRQLEYADSQKIPYVLIVGERELKSGKFKLKDMEKKTERELSLDNVIKELK